MDKKQFLNQVTSDKRTFKRDEEKRVSESVALT
jgi:hypothetical protein